MKRPLQHGTFPFRLFPFTCKHFESQNYLLKIFLPPVATVPAHNKHSVYFCFLFRKITHIFPILNCVINSIFLTPSFLLPLWASVALAGHRLRILITTFQPQGSVLGMPSPFTLGIFPGFVPPTLLLLLLCCSSCGPSEFRQLYVTVPHPWPGVTISNSSPNSDFTDLSHQLPFPSSVPENLSLTWI